MDTPKNISGRYCPLNGKACIKVCHTCEMWEPMELTADGKKVVEWRCAFRWTTLQGAIMNARIDSMGAALEGMRNRFFEFRESVVALVGSIAGVQRHLSYHPREGGTLIEKEDGEKLGSS